MTINDARLCLIVKQSKIESLGIRVILKEEWIYTSVGDTSQNLNSS